MLGSNPGSFDARQALCHWPHPQPIGSVPIEAVRWVDCCRKSSCFMSLGVKEFLDQGLRVKVEMVHESAFHYCKKILCGLECNSVVCRT